MLPLYGITMKLETFSFNSKGLIKTFNLPFRSQIIHRYFSFINPNQPIAQVFVLVRSVCGLFSHYFMINWRDKRSGVDSKHLDLVAVSGNSQYAVLRGVNASEGGHYWVMITVFFPWFGKASSQHKEHSSGDSGIIFKVYNQEPSSWM